MGVKWKKFTTQQKFKQDASEMASAYQWEEAPSGQLLKFIGNFSYLKRFFGYAPHVRSDKESFSNMVAPIDLKKKCKMCSFTEFVTFSNDKNDTCFKNSL